MVSEEEVKGTRYLHTDAQAACRDRVNDWFKRQRHPQSSWNCARALGMEIIVVENACHRLMELGNMVAFIPAGKKPK